MFKGAKAMRLLKILAFWVVLVGVGLIVAAAKAPSLYGQRDDRFDRPRTLSLLAGRGAAIGVSIRDVMPAEAGGQPQAGALIDEVRPDSPADKAGIKRGDVIVEFDGERVRSARQFSRLVQESTPGRTVTAAILRGDQRSSVQITPNDERRSDVLVSGDFGGYMRDFGRDLGRLGDRLPAFDFNFDFDLPAFATGRRLGVSVAGLTSQLADHFGAPGGVLVTSVTEGSAASRAGLKAGDVITSINGARVESREDLLRQLRDADYDARDGSVELNIGIVRDKKESTVKATLESRRPQRGRPI
jgi:C-terminal processing protease CtpA/Prc